MITKQTTAGSCRLCGRSFAKAPMTSHLKSCWKKHAAPGAPKSAGRWLHLVVEGTDSPGYWLHLQASAKATFGTLDSVLRRLWLECCDHMSAFEFPTERPSFRGAGSTDIFALMDAARAAMFMDVEEDDDVMDLCLKPKLQAGATFSHQYDFGSTTRLSLRVAGEYDGPAVEGTIKVLARNDAPAISCANCKQPATRICTDCSYRGRAHFCNACAEDHPCGQERLLPLVNSPRAGVCGYSGPSVEP